MTQKNYTKKKAFYRNKLQKSKAKWGYILMLPWLLVFLVFYLYPLIYGFAISFTDFRLGDKTFIGLRNYIQIFGDYAFWRSLRAMFAYMIIIVPIEVIFPLVIANIIHPFKERNATFVKVIYYLPGVISSVALVIAWKFMFFPNTSILAQLIRSSGGKYRIFSTASSSILIISVLVAFLAFGSHIVIYSAALNAIPETYYEAATLDGATRGIMLRQITIPLMKPTIVYVLVTSTIAALQIFVYPQMLTGGGPNYTTSTLLLLVYNKAFIDQRYGYASAIGCILFVIIGIVSVIQFYVTRSDSVEY